MAGVKNPCNELAHSGFSVTQGIESPEDDKAGEMMLRWLDIYLYSYLRNIDKEMCNSYYGHIK